MAWGRRKKGNDWGYGGWAPYVPVAERRRKAEKKVAAMVKKGEKISPVTISGRTIATTFWGKAWCDNLESYMDFSNRLPRGRTYVRNGSVVDLKVVPGKVKALVSGSSLYTVEITIKPLETPRWQGVIKRCTGKIESLVELLQGKLSKGVMETVTSKDHGLFPEPKQISLNCSCPDSAIMCKHVAATLYGVGSRLDNEPELLFVLRQVDHLELITKASVPAKLDKTKAGKGKALETADLGTMFGIEIDAEAPSAKVTSGRGPPRRPKTVKKPMPMPKRQKAMPLKAASPKKKLKCARLAHAPAAAEDDAAEPAGERRAVAQGAEALVRREERVLRRVCGAVKVAEQAVGITVREVLVAGDERREGGAVAALRFSDELPGLHAFGLPG